MNITIIGCGWLGFQVGESLSNEGHKTLGSYRSPKQKNKLQSSSIKGFELDLNLNSQISTSILDNTDVLILSLPPIKKEEPNYYPSLLLNCVRQFSGSTKVIFTSSIGVYPQKEGRFTEGYLFQENEQSLLLRTESELKEQLRDRLTILRLGGLIGPGRHPIKSLQGRSIANDGNAPINLIHIDDICDALKAVLIQNISDKCYNLVFPKEISKKMYYSSMVNKYDLSPIEYGKDKSLNRSVDGSLICTDLNFSYSLDPQNYSDELH